MRNYSIPTLFILALLLTACGGNRNEARDNVRENANKLDETELPDQDEMADGPMTSNGITLTPMPEATEFPDAVLDDWTYENGAFNYDVSNYEFGVQTPDADAIMCANSGKGQHAHLIVNNEPYIAKYEPTFTHDLPDGMHYILTFLSRSYHLSIKNGTAHRAVKATVANGSFDTTEDIEEPMLFYSRPKGTYTGAKETENILLDFFPVNVDLGDDDYFVRVKVNGSATFDVDNWQPYYLKGLPMGENTVELSLMNGEEVVSAPLNPVTRTFKLQAAPTE